MVRVTGAQLQDAGVEGLEKILEGFDAPGTGTLRVGDTVEARREGAWGHLGRIVHHCTSREARPPYRDTYDVHFGSHVSARARSRRRGQISSGNGPGPNGPSPIAMAGRDELWQWP